MTDVHVHIGQFNETYYDSHEVFAAIEESCGEFGIDEIFFSSTSSCRDDVELFRVEEEIAWAQNFSSKCFRAAPYLWYVPRYAEQNISVKNAASSFDYAGVKLHPFAQKWDLENAKHKKALEEIFAWSSDTGKLVLIHTGIDKSVLPSRFENFFRDFPKAHPVLAHSNPVADTIAMMQKYQNVKCDIAFTPKKSIAKLTKSNFADRILFGTDFPITYYWNKALKKSELTLAEQYRKDCEVAASINRI